MSTSPFRLTHTIPELVGGPLQCVAFCPWKLGHLATLWHGAYNEDHHYDQWNRLIQRWGDCFATANRSYVYVMSAKKPTTTPIAIKLPHITASDPATERRDVTQVAWVMDPTIRSPLLLISTCAILIIFNLESKTVVGRLRGHGYSITSIVVHPILPHIFCTTSRDMTTRMYDLTLTPIQSPNNTCWPPETTPSRAGPAFGLHACEPEGDADGCGRCVAVLIGGRSGGHNAAVLDAAFHPSLPLIATCGLDRHVKIWYVQPRNPEMLAREDKPIFTSSRVHQASVQSIAWLTTDILVSFCSPPIFPEVQEDGQKQLTPGRGTLIIWQWLGRERFFPPLFRDHLVRPGCAADYQESSSFKIVTEYAFPHQDSFYSTPRWHCYAGCDEPLIIYTYPGSRLIHMVRLANMTPRPAPMFPFANVDGEAGDLPDISAHPNGKARNADVRPLSSVEILQLDVNPDGASKRTLEACASGLDGQAIIGVGGDGETAGVVWIWFGNAPPPVIEID